MLSTTFLANPHRDWRPPITLTTYCPILDVGEPFPHPLSSSPLGSPFYPSIMRDYLITDSGHPDEPAIHRVVEKRMVCPPAVWIVMGVCVFSIEKVFGNQEVYDIIIAFLNIPAIQFLVDSFHECSVHSNGVLCREAHLHTKAVVVLPIHNCGMNHSCSIGGGDKICRHDCPSRLRIAPFYGPWK